MALTTAGGWGLAVVAFIAIGLLLGAADGLHRQHRGKELMHDARKCPLCSRDLFEDQVMCVDCRESDHHDE